MTLKKCPCCKLNQTTKNAIKKGRDEIALYFNCANCQSTFILRSKDWQARSESLASTLLSRKDTIGMHTTSPEGYRYDIVIKAFK